ncbi:MAG TPA: SLC13 family permease [Acidimicrobiales bacterium]|nr:SLC13 family permease [Acidimicrobiales bacterium]
MAAVHLTQTLDQTWPPFVLVLGLLLVGVAASSDGLFEAVGSHLARVPGNRLSLFASMMGLVAVVTVVLNLDTSVVFLTPILLHVARRRGVPETAFLYGAIFMSNSASLLLPGSNLTNLLVLAPEHVSGGHFAMRMLAPWVASVLVTFLVVALWRRRDLHGSQERPDPPMTLRPGLATVGVGAAVACMLAFANPALPVLALGLALAAWQVVARRLSTRETLRVVGPATLAGLFVAAVAIGMLARSWNVPSRLLGAAGPWGAAALGAGASATLNNLPAAVLLSPHAPAHPFALLLGLDIGPNLVVIGALSAMLWLRVARRERAAPSARTYSRLGLILTPLALGAGLVALWVATPGSF